MADDKNDVERFDGESLAPSPVFSEDELAEAAKPEEDEIREIGSNAEHPEDAPADEPTLTVSEEGSEDLGLDVGPADESHLQAAADEEAPELDYAQQDRLIAEATAPEGDRPRDPAPEPVPVRVFGFDVAFAGGEIVVSVDALNQERALAVARKYLHDVADSPDFELSARADEDAEVVYPTGEDEEPAEQVGADTPSVPVNP